MPRSLFARALTLTALLWLCFQLPLARSQTFNMEQDRIQMAELKGLWHFHTGDDPRWANPSFDDSSWPLLSSTKSWSEQGYPGYSGMAWYRFQVIVPANHGPLALYLPLYTNYEVFVNGTLRGQYGHMPPHAVPYDGVPELITVPVSKEAGTSPIEIALRVWHWPVWAPYTGGGPRGISRIGDQAVMTAYRKRLTDSYYYYLASSHIQLVIALLAGLAALGFYMLYQLDSEYLWFGLYQLAIAAYFITGAASYSGPHTHEGEEILTTIFQVAERVFFLTFFWTIFRHRLTIPFWIAAAVACVELPPIFLGDYGLISIPHANLAIDVSVAAVALFVLAELGAQARRRNRGAAVLGLFVFLKFGTSLFYEVTWILFTAGHTKAMEGFDWFFDVTPSIFPVSVPELTDILMQLAIIAVLIARFARSRRDEQRLTSELEAARTVQHVIIPEEIPSIPQLKIEALYRPATEVGGDFFQVIPLPKNSVLIAIGDVSGKGMPAAMTVSLLIGTLRTLADFQTSPGAILEAMNHRLVGRSSGFTTCLLARIDNAQNITFANAGHLAPYAGTREVSVEAGIPLGLTSEATYVETTFTLAIDEQLTFLTDGVVEAQSAKGELFGFERTQALAGQSAATIAASAQQFGQQDDITVLTVTRLASPHGEASIHVDSTLRNNPLLGAEFA